jgi:C-terminal processing protease CtpA/Prc
MIRRRTGTVPLAILILAILISSTSAARQQPPQKVDKFKVEQALRILEMVQNEVKNHYYDPTFHGVNIDAAFARAKDKISGIDSFNEDFIIIASTLDTLQDSHTYFIPPPRPYYIEDGFRRKMIGDKCFVTAVEPDSDAFKQGLKSGDQLVTINQFPPDRATLWKLDYLYGVLNPQPELILEVQSPDGARCRIRTKSEVVHYNTRVSGDEIVKSAAHQHELERPRYAEFGDDLVVINIPNFAMSTNEVETMASKIRKHKAAVLDMRGNPGGLILQMEDLLRNLFNRDVHIFDRVSKAGRKPENIKGSGGRAYTGKIIALVDSQSDSAAELTARVLQLEKRGTVIGDRSAGKVREARTYFDQLGVDTLFGFGTSVTDADLIMSDGKSLENTGVDPDEVILPTAADLSAGRDPLLSRAAALSSVLLTSENAGKLFPYQWMKPADWRNNYER